MFCASRKVRNTFTKLSKFSKRGYLFALSPKEMTRFMMENFEAGFLAYEQVLTDGSPLEKSAAKAELDEHFALLKKRPVAVA